MDNKHLLITAVAATLSFSSMEAKQTTSLDERIAMKKLSEYWQEKDELRVQATAMDFVKKYPHSAYTNQLYAMLGDLHFSKKNYPEALTAYQQIKDPVFKQKTAFHHLLALYELEKFAEFMQEAPAFIKDASSSESETITFELAESYRYTGQLELAITHYEELKNTPFEAATLEPLAHLYVTLENYPKASHTYLKWAQQEKEEENLFQAAHCQSHYDQKLALRTLDRVFKMKGALAPQAGYNMIVMLFQMQRYNDVVLAARHVGTTVPEEHLCAVQYYVGKSLFYTHDFESAAASLEEALTLKGNELFQERIALTLISCAKETNDLSLCDRMIKRVTSAENLYAARLIHAQLCRNHKEWSVAREDIEMLLVEHPNHPEKETLLYDLATLLMKEGKGEESAQYFDAFAAEYPQSVHRVDALRNSLHLKVEAVSALSGKEKVSAQEQLVRTLKSDLAEQELFSVEECKRMQLLLAQTSFHLHQIPQTISLLQDYIKEDPSCKEAYLLLCVCYQESDDASYITCAEQLLKLDPQTPHHAQLHLGLFNRYLRLCETAKAADHLFQVTDGSISQENQRWLASYYLQHDYNPVRAICVLEKLLKLHGDKPLLAPHVEAEALRLAQLYREQTRHLDSVTLLSALTKEQKEQPLLEWKQSRKAQFELGRSYALAGNPEKAIEIYQDLISSASHITSYFRSAAILELAKLQFSAETASQTCDQLKEIEVARQLYSEPLHTEAGLHYVHMKTQLTEEGLKQEKHYALLSQVKQGLAHFHDPKADQFPEKQELINQYLSYIDIELSQLKGEPVETTRIKLHALLLSVSNETLKERIVKTLENLDHPL